MHEKTARGRKGGREDLRGGGRDRRESCRREEERGWYGGREWAGKERRERVREGRDGGREGE